MKTSIATVCLSGGLNEKLEAIAAAGFRGVEIFESDLLSYSGTPADVARQIADLGLKVSTFQPFRDFEGTLGPQRARTFDRAERKFDVMQEIGCDFLLVCSNVSPDSVGGIDRAAADFRELGERCRMRPMCKLCQNRLARRPAVGRRCQRLAPPRKPHLGQHRLSPSPDDRREPGIECQYRACRRSDGSSVL